MAEGSEKKIQRQYLQIEWLKISFEWSMQNHIPHLNKRSTGDKADLHTPKRKVNYRIATCLRHHSLQNLD